MSEQSQKHAQMPSLSVRHHSFVRALVSALFVELPRSRRNQAGTWTARRSHDHLPLSSNTLHPSWIGVAVLR